MHMQGKVSTKSTPTLSYSPCLLPQSSSAASVHDPVLLGMGEHVNNFLVIFLGPNFSTSSDKGKREGHILSCMVSGPGQI